MVLCESLLGRCGEDALARFDRLIAEGAADAEGRFNAQRFAFAAFTAAISENSRGARHNPLRWAERSAALSELLSADRPTETETFIVSAGLAAGMLVIAIDCANEDVAGDGPLEGQLDKDRARSSAERCQRALDLGEARLSAGVQRSGLWAFAAIGAGTLYAWSDEFGLALECFERADALLKASGMSREEIDPPYRVELFYRVRSLEALGRAEEAFRLVQGALARVKSGELTGVNDDILREWRARLLWLAENTGSEHNLDAPSFVDGSAFIALRRFAANSVEEAFRWLERSEEAREAAALPPTGDRLTLAQIAFSEANRLMEENRLAAAAIACSRAISLFEQVKEPEPIVLYHKGMAYATRAFCGAWAIENELAVGVDVEPARFQRNAELLEVSFDYFRRAVEILEPILDQVPDARGTWAGGLNGWGTYLAAAGRTEEAIHRFESILKAVEERGREEIPVVTLVGTWVRCASCLNALGRREEALRRLRDAQQLAEEKGETALLDAFREEIQILTAATGST